MTPASSAAPSGGVPPDLAAGPPAGTGSSAETAGRHNAPALWMVLAAVLTAVLSAQWLDARVGAMVLAGTLFVAAVARLAYRGRKPEGIAVRSTVTDVLVLLVLAGGIGLLALSPNVGR